MNSCCCCLRCPPDKGLTTPYSHLGQIEVYSDMLEECFDLHLTLHGDEKCGICEQCVGRLQDASDFKLQVQKSQDRLQKALLVIVPSGSAADAAPQPGPSALHPAQDIPETYACDTCDTCEQHFKEKNNVVEHLQTHKRRLTIKKKKSHVCNVCHKTFKQKGDLDRHKCEFNKHNKTHAAENTKGSDESNTKVILKSEFGYQKIVQTEAKPYSCEECNMQLRTRVT